MRFNYDKKQDALYIRFHEAPYFESDEVGGGIILDYNRAGRLIGLEVLDASRKMPREFNRYFNGKKLPAVFDIARA